MSGKDPEPNGFGPSRRRREVPGADPDSRLPPGAAPGGGVSLTADGDENLSKAALKNKKKREAKKAKDAEAKASGLTAPTENGSSSSVVVNGHQTPERRDRARSPSKSAGGSAHASRPSSRRREGSRQRGPPLNTNSTPASKPQQNGNAPPPLKTEPEPEAPELTVTSPGAGSPHEKKIRSLLKKLRAIDDLKMRQAGGEKLEGTQVLKIGTEGGVRGELAELGFVE